MAPPRLRLSKSQAADLLKICSLGRGRLLDLATVLSNSDEPPIISRAILRSRMTAAIPADYVEATSRLFFGLAIIARDNFTSQAEFLSGLDEAVSSLNWSAEDIARWNDARDALVAVLWARDLVLAAKAMDLIFDFEKFCLNTRIITDVRPVFDDQRIAIVGGIIMHTLRIEYRADDGRRKNISIELDSRDIERLTKSCTDAITKMNRAKELFSEQLKLPWITATEGLE
jgi:hypothetical protein